MEADSDNIPPELKLPRPDSDFLRPPSRTVESPPLTPSTVYADDLDLDLLFAEEDDGASASQSVTASATALQSLASIQSIPTTKPGLDVFATPFVPSHCVSESILYYTPNTMSKHRYAVSDRYIFNSQCFSL